MSAKNERYVSEETVAPLEWESETRKIAYNLPHNQPRSRLKTRTKPSTLCLYYLRNYILTNVFKLNKVRDQYSLPQSDLALVPADTAMLVKALPWVSHQPPTEQRARLS